jgi:hypothetical protein
MSTDNMSKWYNMSTDNMSKWYNMSTDNMSKWYNMSTENYCFCECIKSSSTGLTSTNQVSSFSY